MRLVSWHLHLVGRAGAGGGALAALAVAARVVGATRRLHLALGVLGHQALVAGQVLRRRRRHGDGDGVGVVLTGRHCDFELEVVVVVDCGWLWWVGWIGWFGCCWERDAAKSMADKSGNR